MGAKGTQTSPMSEVVSGCFILNKATCVPTLGPPDPQTRVLRTPTYRRAWNLPRSTLSTDSTKLTPHCFSPTKAPKQESSVHSGRGQMFILVLAAPGFILSSLGNSGHTAFCSTIPATPPASPPPGPLHVLLQIRLQHPLLQAVPLAFPPAAVTLISNQNHPGGSNAAVCVRLPSDRVGL